MLKVKPNSLFQWTSTLILDNMTQPISNNFLFKKI